ncbi:phage baseplate assembly protein domain-containing protein [Methylomonas sp. 11b]|uniref:phage baseplate assembly protein domain-containing protein n=1 Tax=Methylomonas sp. 11b TaxID=1168169 RepID=UPI0004799D75|nr:phage baseplate assembly protein [Methylomonas sp. 11b]
MDGAMRRLQLMITRGVVSLVDSASLLQLLQIKTIGAVALDSVEHFEPYGWTSHAHPGAEAITLSAGGRAGHEVAICVADRQYRLVGLAAGEVAIYDDLGQTITLKRDHIHVKSPKVVVESDDIHLGGEGGAKVARVGDKVNVGSGSSAGLWPIVEGSDKVKAL